MLNVQQNNNVDNGKVMTVHLWIISFLFKKSKVEIKLLFLNVFKLNQKFFTKYTYIFQYFPTLKLPCKLF